MVKYYLPQRSQKGSNVLGWAELKYVGLSPFITIKKGLPNDSSPSGKIEQALITRSWVVAKTGGR